MKNKTNQKGIAFLAVLIIMISIVFDAGAESDVKNVGSINDLNYQNGLFSVDEEGNVEFIRK